MKPYEPNRLPIDDLDFRRLLTLVGQANAELARYEAGIPTPEEKTHDIQEVAYYRAA